MYLPQRFSWLRLSSVTAKAVTALHSLNGFCFITRGVLSLHVFSIWLSEKRYFLFVLLNIRELPSSEQVSNACPLVCKFWSWRNWVLGWENQNYAYLTPLANHSTGLLVLTPGEFQNLGKCQIHQRVLWVEWLKPVLASTSHWLFGGWELSLIFLIFLEAVQCQIKELIRIVS